jgi:hypothetical protein
MNLKTMLLAGSLLLAVPLATGWAQLPSETTRIYTLLSGSELTDDCPICDRIPIVVPLTGTFRLRFLDETPLYTRYEIQDIAFQADTTPWWYQVSGRGSYQVGGEVAVVQDLFLDVNITNGVTNTRALCVNMDRTVTQPWPRIQIQVAQTNGTETQLYSLLLIAAPALQFRAIIPDPQTGDVRLQWDSNGGQAQLERATAVAGPYTPISPITTSLTFTDRGALTNQSLFYRLCQY